jgi:hypothetical protein
MLGIYGVYIHGVAGFATRIEENMAKTAIPGLKKNFVCL